MKTWVAKEAYKILEKVQNKTSITLETGYGPSSIPHVGTVMEVVRTLMIAKFLKHITNKKIIVISHADDVDGMRKVPPNLPNQEMLNAYMFHPLYKIPDPYSELSSMSERAMFHLKEFFTTLSYTYTEYRPKNSKIDFAALNTSDSDIVIIRSSDMYNSGALDEILLLMLANHQALLDIILPTLGEERQKTYSLFMPISSKTDHVLSTGVIKHAPDKGGIFFTEDGEEYFTPVTGGHCKLQWKFDMVGHWLLLDVDYEMAGKDISTGTTPIAVATCQTLGKAYPVTMMYEMLLDGEGQKMSKTKGNAVELNHFFRYLTPQGTKHFMFGYPKSAKRVELGKMPLYLDLYLEDLESYNKLNASDPDRLNHPIWYIDENMPSSQISASMALNMIQSFQLPDLNLLLQSIGDLNQTEISVITAMYHFYHEQYSPPKRITPPAWIKPYISDIAKILTLNEESIKSAIYDLGKDAVSNGNISSLREWFSTLYQCLFGQDSGPRLHAFLVRYGPENSKKLLESICENNQPESLYNNI